MVTVGLRRSPDLTWWATQRHANPGVGGGTRERRLGALEELLARWTSREGHHHLLEAAGELLAKHRAEGLPHLSWRVAKDPAACIRHEEAVRVGIEGGSGKGSAPATPELRRVRRRLRVSIHRRVRHTVVAVGHGNVHDRVHARRRILEGIAGVRAAAEELDGGGEHATIVREMQVPRLTVTACGRPAPARHAEVRLVRELLPALNR
mmetsp:Transcript_20552/g.52441  ORF Transcript_20552/g.52441 Transcript_20552/m.52441 type:complete len:207 (+) Transcript_20552:448-1068(+)